jgi:hypothetical protein
MQGRLQHVCRVFDPSRTFPRLESDQRALVSEGSEGSVLLRPVLDNQPLYARELASIGGYQNEIPTECLSGNQRVIFADALAPEFEFRANLTSSLCISLGIVEQRNLIAKECNKGSRVVGRQQTLRYAVPKLMSND